MVYGDLTTFAALAYGAIGEFQQFLPEHGQKVLPTFPRRGRAWPRYGERRTVLRAMNYILERLRLAHLAPELDAIVGAHLPALMEDFETYFPELHAMAGEWKRENL